MIIDSLICTGSKTVSLDTLFCKNHPEKNSCNVGRLSPVARLLTPTKNGRRLLVAAAPTPTPPSRPAAGRVIPASAIAPVEGGITANPGTIGAALAMTRTMEKIK